MGTGGSATIAGRESGLFHGMWSNVCSMLWLWWGRWMRSRWTFRDGRGVYFFWVGRCMSLHRRMGFGLRRGVVRPLWSTWCGLWCHYGMGVVWAFTTHCRRPSVLGHGIEPVVWVLRGHRTGTWWHSSLREWWDCDGDMWLWEGLESEPLPPRWTVSFIGHTFVVLRPRWDFGSVGSGRGLRGWLDRCRRRLSGLRRYRWWK